MPRRYWSGPARWPKLATNPIAVVVRSPPDLHKALTALGRHKGGGVIVATRRFHQSPSRVDRRVDGSTSAALKPVGTTDRHLDGAFRASNCPSDPDDLVGELQLPARCGASASATSMPFQEDVVLPTPGEPHPSACARSDGAAVTSRMLQCMSPKLAVRPEGANHQWRRVPHG
jgi:hypothetical protein